MTGTAGPVTDTGEARVRAFLADSLALWRVDGSVEAGHAPVVAAIRAQSGVTISIERPVGEDMPFRWLVHSRGGTDGSGNPATERTRPCASLVGLLNAVRDVLGVDRGSALRVAPAPEESSALSGGGAAGAGRQ